MRARDFSSLGFLNGIAITTVGVIAHLEPPTPPLRFTFSSHHLTISRSSALRGRLLRAGRESGDTNLPETVTAHVWRTLRKPGGLRSTGKARALCLDRKRGGGPSSSVHRAGRHQLHQSGRRSAQEVGVRGSSVREYGCASGMTGLTTPCSRRAEARG